MPIYLYCVILFHIIGGNPLNKMIVLLTLLFLLVSVAHVNTVAQVDGSYDYVIVTTHAIVDNSSVLTDFIGHKEDIGFSVYVATEDDYEQVIGPPPNGRAEKIRQWLIENYVDMGITYVLLIGNPDPDHPVNPLDSIGDIPMKTCMASWKPELPFYTLYFLKNDYPADYYYADLSGNWDFDGDGMYGEYLYDYLHGEGAGVNFTPEVFVGRIPVYDESYDDLDHILRKTIDYERESVDLEYRTKVLLPMSFVKTWFDHARLGEQIVSSVLIPHNFSYWRMYQQGSSFRFLDSEYPSEEELLDGVVKERWSKEPFGIVCWVGHGDEAMARIGTSMFPAGTLFSRDDCHYLDDTHPAFTFQISCLNGKPEVSDNLGYCLLRHGAIATVSASRPTSLKYEEPEDFVESFSSGGIAYDYVRYLVEGYSAGEALYFSKMSPLPTHPVQSGFIRNIYCYNLYGDPSLHLLPTR
jgi:hypothetical protein